MLEKSKGSVGRDAIDWSTQDRSRRTPRRIWKRKAKEEALNKFAENRSNGGTECIRYAPRNNRNTDDPPCIQTRLSKKFGQKPEHFF
jgi:hypothetical protein